MNYGTLVGNLKKRLKMAANGVHGGHRCPPLSLSKVLLIVA